MLYPNPTSDNAILSITGLIGNENAKIVITDITGKTVVSDIPYTFNNGVLASVIKTDNFNKGVYFVNIIINGILISQKLIID